MLHAQYGWYCTDANYYLVGSCKAEETHSREWVSAHTELCEGGWGTASANDVTYFYLISLECPNSIRPRAIQGPFCQVRFRQSCFWILLGLSLRASGFYLAHMDPSTHQYHPVNLRTTSHTKSRRVKLNQVYSCPMNYRGTIYYQVHDLLPNPSPAWLCATPTHPTPPAWVTRYLTPSPSPTHPIACCSP